MSNQIDQTPPVSHWSDLEIAAKLPQLAVDANKYTRGELTVVAGSSEYPGAAIIASWASQIMGAGYTRVICAPESVDTVRGARASLVVASWEDKPLSDLVVPSHHRRGTLVGSGFDGNDDYTRDLSLGVIGQMPGPVVVDGGAITALASDAGIAAAKVRAEQGWPLVVTPHGGEAARLAKAANISDSLAPEVLSPALANFYQAIIVLKGPDTYISDGKQVVAMTSGTAALAKAGTGDALAGIIAALVTLGLEPLDAGVVGATLHAEAGKYAAQCFNELSVCPEDVIQALPHVITSFEKLRNGVNS